MVSVNEKVETGKKMSKIEYTSWPIGQVPKHLQNPNHLIPFLGHVNNILPQK